MAGGKTGGTGVSDSQRPLCWDGQFGIYAKGHGEGGGEAEGVWTGYELERSLCLAVEKG